MHLAGVTAHPRSAWVAQQARNLAIEDRLSEAQFLIRDRDAKYSGPFDEVFGCEGVRVIRTPIRSPKANAFAERFVRTVRHECLDHILVFGEHHLEGILREYISRYNKERPHCPCGGRSAKSLDASGFSLRVVTVSFGLCAMVARSTARRLSGRQRIVSSGS